jgi:hypothetical protein
MSAGLIDSVAKVVSSPPAQLVAGAALAGLVWKTFQRVENVLNKKAKRQIAAWLYGVKVRPKLDRWYDEFVNAINGFADLDDDQVDERIFIWSLVPILPAMVMLLTVKINNPWQLAVRKELVFHNPYPYLPTLLLPGLRFMTLMPGFVLMTTVSMLFSAGFLRALSRTSGFWLRILILTGQFLVSLYLGLAAAASGLALNRYVRAGSSYDLFVAPNSSYEAVFGTGLTMWLHPLTLLARVWNTGVLAMMVAPSLALTFGLLLFSTSGLILKVALRLDLGFSWFVRWFDVKEKPLQSVGLVAGVIFALIYWGLIVIVRY